MRCDGLAFLSFIQVEVPLYGKTLIAIERARNTRNGQGVQVLRANAAVQVAPRFVCLTYT